MTKVFSDSDVHNSVECSRSCNEVRTNTGSLGDILYCEAHEAWWRMEVSTPNLNSWRHLKKPPAHLQSLVSRLAESRAPVVLVDTDTARKTLWGKDKK